MSLLAIRCMPDNKQNEVEKLSYDGPYFYDIETANLNVEEHSLSSGEFIETILLRNKFSRSEVYDFKAATNDNFDLGRMKAGHNYYLLRDSLDELQFLVYDIDLHNYIVCETKPPYDSYLGENEVELVGKVVSGIVDTNLYSDLEKLNVHESLGDKLASIYGWVFDFGKLEKGDRFEVLYDERMVNGKSGGISEIKVARIHHEGERKYAIRYTTKDGNTNYFDQNGNSIIGLFLKSPLKYGRITSRYSKKRLHPVKKKERAHLGTDFAAPLGTAIRSTAAGKVIEIAYKGGNGNYIKIKHNDTYTTQYLHIKKFGRGIENGADVEQGQTIGYVGSTGLSTGPHVCYRFWKNGAQVDPFKEKTQMLAPIPREEASGYLDHVYELLDQLEGK